MNAEMIELIIKWGPIALVGIVFLFYFINGAIKGTYKVIRRLVYVLLFISLSFIFMKDITNFLLDLNVTINGIQGVRNYLVHLIETNETINNFLSYSPDLKELVIGNPSIILAPILFILMVLVVLPLSFPIYWVYLIIWNLFAKYVFKREKYEKNDDGEILRNEKGKKIKIKRKKRRLLGGLVFGVQGVCLICVTLLPVNFINRIYNNAKKSIKLEEGENLCSSIQFAELNPDICMYFDMYNETIFAKLGGENSVDKFINDSLTSVEVNGEKISLETELSNVVSSAILLDSSGLLKLLMDGVNLDTLDLSLINFDSINKSLDALFGSYTIQKLSEAGVGYLLNEVLNDKLVDLLKDDDIVSKIEYDDYSEIRDELKSIVNIIKYIVDEEMDRAIIDNKDDYVNMLNNISEEDIEGLINKLLSIRIINNAMPSLLRAYAEEFGVTVPSEMTSELNNEIASTFGNAVKFVQTMEATSMEDITEGNIVENLSNLLFENGVMKTNTKESLATLLHEFNGSYLFNNLLPTYLNKMLEGKDYKIDARVLKYVETEDDWKKELTVLEKGFDIYSDYGDSETIYYDKVTSLLENISGTKVMISILPFAYGELLPKLGLEVDSSGMPSIDFGESTESSSKELFYRTWEDELTVLKNVADSFGQLQLQSLEDITIDLLKNEDKVDALSSVMGTIYESDMLKSPFVDFMKETMNGFVSDFGVEFSKDELLSLDTKAKWENEFSNIGKVLDVDFSNTDNIDSTSLKTVFDAVGAMELFKSKKVTILKYAVENSGMLQPEELTKIKWPTSTDQQEIDDFYNNETSVILKIVNEKDTIQSLGSLDLNSMNTEEIGGLLNDIMDSNILKPIVVSKMVELFTSDDVNIRDDRDYNSSLNDNLETSISSIGVKENTSWVKELNIIKEMLNITSTNFNEEVTAGVTRVEKMFDDIENSDLLSNMRANILMKAVSLLNMSEASTSGVDVGMLKDNEYAQYNKEIDVIVSVSENKNVFDSLASIELKTMDTASVGGLLDKVMNSKIFSGYAVDKLVDTFEKENIEPDDTSVSLETSISSIGVKENTSWVKELNIIKDMLNITADNFNEEVTAGVTRVEQMFNDIKQKSDLLAGMRANILIKAVGLLNMSEADVGAVSVNSLKANDYEQYDKEIDVIVSVSENKSVFDSLASIELKTMDTASVGGLLDKVMNSKIFSGYAVDKLVDTFEKENIEPDDTSVSLESSISSIGVVENTSWVDELAIVKDMLNITSTNFNEEVTAGVTRIEKMFSDIGKSPLLGKMKANILIKAVGSIGIEGVNTTGVSVDSLKARYDNKDYYQYEKEIAVLVTFAENQSFINEIGNKDIFKLSSSEKNSVVSLLNSIKYSEIFKDKYVYLLEGKDGVSGALATLRANSDLTSYGVSVVNKDDTNNYRTIDWANEISLIDVINSNIGILKSYDENTITKTTDVITVDAISNTIGSTLDAVAGSDLLKGNATTAADELIANKLIVQITDGKVSEIDKGTDTWTNVFKTAINAYIAVLNMQ